MRRSPRQITAGVAGVVILGMLAPSAGALTGPPTWNPRERVSAETSWHVAHAGADRALACDHHGNVGIAFYHRVDDDLAYAQRMPGFAWRYWKADTGYLTGEDPSLAFDRYERPAISHFGRPEVTDAYRLLYTWYDGSQWHTTTVDANYGCGHNTSLAFDLYGRPAIAYFDANSDRLKFACDADGDGTFTTCYVTAAATYQGGDDPTLAFDSQNRPMIVHHGGGDIYFSMLGPGGWITTVVEDNAAIVSPSLAIDPDTDFPAIVYSTVNDWNLTYAHWNGRRWVKTTVDPNGTYCWSPSLAFDPADGNPAIAYERDNDLWFAWNDGSSWHTELLDADAGETPSLAFNEYGDGWPVISYLSEAAYSTVYFIEDPPADVPEPTSAALLIAGGLAAVVVRRRRQES